LDLQQQVARLLLESGYRVLLVYRGNRTGAAGVTELGARHPDRVAVLKIQEFFDGGVEALLKLKIESLELVISGLSLPSGQEREGCSVDMLRRSMQEIPYAVANLLQMVKPLVMKSRQKLVVVTSTILGSTSSNFTGRSIALRAATSALNQIVKSFSVEAEGWGGIYVLVSPNTSEDFGPSPGESSAVIAAKFVKTVGMLSFVDNGCWYNTQKQAIPW